MVGVGAPIASIGRRKKKKKINVGAIPVMPVFYKSTERSERGERRVNR